MISSVFESVRLFIMNPTRTFGVFEMRMIPLTVILSAAIAIAVWENIRPAWSLPKCLDELRVYESQVRECLNDAGTLAQARTCREV